MDPEKVLKLMTEYLGDWSRITLLTLSRPISRFEPAAVAGHSTNSALHDVQTEKQLWLHPKLLIFAIVSIILGLSMNGLIPRRTPSPELLASVLIVFLYWVISASWLHLVCRMLRGKGEYLETLSVTLLSELAP
jgi:Yip1 domain